jgi:hypothetical protein
MTDQEIRQVANEVLRETLGPHGFESADVRPAPDFDGEPSLYVTAHFRPQAGVTSGEASTRALSVLRKRLLDRGEERFPYIRYDYPDDEVLGDDPSDTISDRH